jgi:glycosylphosphatidylinositol deacylase
MVAKGLFLDPSFDKSLVRVIITLVTPHKSPVLALDSFIAKYYDSVNAYWRANRRADREGNLSHVTFASIGGGHRDILVRSGLTQTEEADINVVVSYGVIFKLDIYTYFVYNRSLVFNS